MAPGRKTSSRRPSTLSPSQLSPSDTQPQEIPPQNSDALGDSASLAQSTNAGPPPSKRVRGKTAGKGVDKLIAQNGGEKLFVPVQSNWKSLCGVNATKATSLLGVYLRMMSPVKNTPTWWHVDQATQSVVIQAVLDKFNISEDYHGNPLAQLAVNTKCYHIHLNWRYRMKRHYDNIIEQGLDTYTHPYDQVTLEDWRHMIDDVWTCDKFKKRSIAGKINRRELKMGHSSGSRSFVVEMTTPVENGGSQNKDFPELYEKTHTNKDKEWIHPTCAEKHAEMLEVREEATQSGVILTPEDMSRQVLGKRRKYLLGLGVGPKRSSSSDASNVGSQARDKEFLQKMRMEREEEKIAREAEMEKMRTEREEEKRALEVEMKMMQMERDEARREREEIRMEREAEKRERQAERTEHELYKKRVALVSLVKQRQGNKKNA